MISLIWGISDAEKVSLIARQVYALGGEAVPAPTADALVRVSSLPGPL